MKPHISLSLVASLLLLASCATPEEEGQQTAATQASVQKDLDIQAIEQIIGIKGTENQGEYKVTVPQNDLDVSVDGFKIIPPMGMGSWLAFAPTADGAMVMGDVVVQEDEIGPVEAVVIEQGMTVTGLHNHFVREEPSVMYMHLGGRGSEEELARGVRAIFDKVAELRGGDPSEAKARTVQNTLDTEQIAEILGYSGSMNRGVYKVTMGRPDVNLMNQRTPVSTFMGFNTWVSWQGTPERAAVAGDFTMLEDEVAPVIEALVEHGIEVVAVHNHMVHEEPRVFFLHYWGTGSTEALARGLRAALDRTGK